MSHESRYHIIADHFPHIGMRKIKSVFAIFLGFWVWQAIRLIYPALEVHPIYIYIYGMIEIRDTSEKTVNMTRLRLKATFTAIFFGLPYLILVEQLQSMVAAQWAGIALELIMLMLGVLLTLIIAEKVGCQTFCGLAAAMFLILLISHNDQEKYIYSALRACQTLIGVFLAWLINVKWFPYHGKPSGS